MTQSNLIKNQQQFVANATEFFHTLFESSLNSNCGDIEIRTFPKEQHPKRTFCKSETNAAKISHQLCNQGIDVYVGVNPRVGNAGKKENVHYLAAFHAEVDYGSDGHKKDSEYANYEEAQAAIEKFKMKPTIVNHSGGGFHCYWVLYNPVEVSAIGIPQLESINKALIKKLGGDSGTHDISRVLRVPGTFNFKLEGKTREVVNLWLDGPRYKLQDFQWLIEEDEADIQKTKKASAQNPKPTPAIMIASADDIEKLPIPERIKKLILNGCDYGIYPSRSEADMAVILALVNKGISDQDIKSIFENYPIGSKYHEHPSPDKYLTHSIQKAKELSHLTEDERMDPLFISGALTKSDSGNYQLNIVPFQEYMNKKHMLKFLEKERAFFRYNGICYEQCSDDRLNHICQADLGNHRALFTPASKANFIHFAIGNDLVDAEKAYEDQVRYLTMQNGLYDLTTYELIPHDSSIFTTNLLPYDYDPDAECPRWLKYLDEVFLSDTDTILFVQEAVGYAFHKAIPKAVLFFLIGDGGNGKSVFIDVISSLCGTENVCNISLNRLNDEKYLPELFGKMINVSGETPNARCMNTDIIKSVVAGDWVTGREVYKRPSKFKPYAKHYLGMNTLPEIDDNTHGMWRRIHVIEFPRKFTEGEMDVELTEKLMQELSGIFNWALDGYRRLRDQGFIFSESRSMQISKKRYKQQNSSVLDFAESHLLNRLQSELSLPLKDAFDNYREFCSKEGVRRTLSKKEFRSALESEGYLIENSSKHANQVRIFGHESEVMN
jgi:putative DNA primase/helicase